MSPTARTLKALRASGFTAGVVEAWIPGAGVRRDLFGVIDVVAVRRGEIGVLAIQATSLTNVSARVTKARGRGELSVWLAAGQRFEVWGWFRRGHRWAFKRVELAAGDVSPLVLPCPRRRAKRRQASLFADVNVP